MVQKIIKVGNSAAITIPKSLLNELGVKIGTKVDVSYRADNGSFVVGLPKRVKDKSHLSREFHQWLEQFLEEDHELLKELASR